MALDAINNSGTLIGNERNGIAYVKIPGSTQKLNLTLNKFGGSFVTNSISGSAELYDHRFHPISGY